VFYDDRGFLPRQLRDPCHFLNQLRLCQNRQPSAVVLVPDHPGL
jgi:hypothetical protein